MTAAAPHFDPRFPTQDVARTFRSLQHAGTFHTSMRPAGFHLHDRQEVLPTPREIPVRARLDETRDMSILSRDPRLADADGMVSRPVGAGLQWKTRRTQEFVASRVFATPSASEMRPAGVSTKKRGEIFMSKWSGYKDTVRRLDCPIEGAKLVASCPDLAVLVGTGVLK
mmetsp:Transcript_71378/g.170892  ORF Transcript_71378/g.170892 Transcript_71378/m.170892 type:complete len:169 (-) Transcript_71378:134-640(-)